MIGGLRRFQKVGQADISAVLLIAFLFQLFTPIFVFATETTEQDAYQAALRNSICQVMLAELDAQDLPSDEQTDGFVCDWCLRGKILAFAQPVPVLSWSIDHRHLVTQVTYHDIQTTLQTQIRGNIALSRAPPLSS